jgi:hypothetical protein
MNLLVASCVTVAKFHQIEWHRENMEQQTVIDALLRNPCSNRERMGLQRSVVLMTYSDVQACTNERKLIPEKNSASVIKRSVVRADDARQQLDESQCVCDENRGGGAGNPNFFKSNLVIKLLIPLVSK